MQPCVRSHGLARWDQSDEVFHLPVAFRSVIVSSSSGIDAGDIPGVEKYPNFCWEVHHHRRRCYFVHAANQEEKDEWVKVFKMCCRHCYGCFVCVDGTVCPCDCAAIYRLQQQGSCGTRGFQVSNQKDQMGTGPMGILDIWWLWRTGTVWYWIGQCLGGTNVTVICRCWVIWL